MRTNQHGDFCAKTLLPEGKAIILYHEAPSDLIPTTEAEPLLVEDATCQNVSFPCNEES